MDTKSFENVLYALSPNIREILTKLSPTVKSNTEEIRLRSGLPLALTVQGDTVFVRENGKTVFEFLPDLPRVSKEDINESFKKLCGGAVYAHEKELKEGFIIMKNGCRAGVFGTVNESGFMSDITSINIRIARQVLGSANDVVQKLGVGGLLIVGPPGSGKTTVLRDLVRQVSNGKAGKMQRIAVIDSRGEISGGYNGQTQNNLGNNTDVLFTRNKAKGMEIAIRTMFPDIVAFDEIGSNEELESVEASLHTGVRIFTTAHVGSFAELTERSITANLLKSGAVSQIALLPKLHGGEIKVISVKEIYRNAVV